MYSVRIIQQLHIYSKANCKIDTLCLLVRTLNGFHVGFLGVFPLVDGWEDCPCLPLPLGWGRLPVEAWAKIGADGLYGEREEFEGVAFEG
jgi:hypothetical protein